MTEQLLIVDQVAELLAVSRWFVYDHQEALGGVKLGEGKRAPLRFPREGVEAYIAGFRDVAGGESAPPDRVTGKDGKSYPAPRRGASRGRRRRVPLA